MENITDIYRAILEQPGVRVSPPATGSDFTAFEEGNGFSVPNDLKSVLAISNGARLSDDFELLSLESAAQYSGIHSSLLLLALTDENDSNPYCLICASPFIGKVMHLDHEGDSRLSFSSLGAFLTALQTHGPSDFFEREGISEDITGTCLKALRWAESLTSDDDSRTLVHSLAFSGLGAGCEDRIQYYLSDEDEYVYEAARQRLIEIDTPAAKKAIYNDSIAYERFIADTTAVLASAGIRVTENRRPGAPPSIRIDPGAIHLNMRMFYAKRNDPGIFQKILERSQHFLKNAQK